MNPRKISKILLVLISLSCLVTGCWDVRTIDRRSYVTMIGVDMTEQGLFRVFAQVVIPRKLVGGGQGGGGGEEKTFAVLSAEGTTILEALRNMEPVDSRHLDLSHIRAYIFSEKIARMGISPVLDFFLRYPETPPDAWVLVAKEEMGKIMETKHYSEQMPAVYVDVFFKETGQRTAQAIPVKLWEFNRNLYNSSLEPYAPCIGLKRDVGEEPEKGKDKEKQGGDEGSANLEIRGTALFHRGMMVGEITPQETQLLNWLLGKRTYGTLTIEDPRFPGRYMTITVQELKLVIDPRHDENGNISFRVRMYTTAFVDESLGYLVRTKKDTAAIKEQFDRTMEFEMTRFITKLQQDYRVDAAGLGNKFRRHHQEIWEKLNWQEEWPNAYVKLEVITTIRNRGEIQ
jgi:spore germination protein KC